ncbi:alpha-xylosidase [Schaalia hyovaginalis]|uniref:alpha-xylosidase n=1 Tax=Schaalia hyovaginalis TaxID=29316 RepID=UPI0026EF4F7D|nr:alpha-xylosidase [Schaalia hyovaginalis]MCI6556763.1 alpha-xylosidase [Schaalia hyovaginalis]MDD7554825.1 alpha-xylosidase [Schaalia hyovaginalis]MDY3093235.1 alpha-xylosidase [Schaalia hyovaginalis]
MKFSDGFWLDRRGWTVERARQMRGIEVDADAARIGLLAPVKEVLTRGDTLNTGAFDLSVEAVADGVLKVCVERWKGKRAQHRPVRIALPEEFPHSIDQDEEGTTLCAGDLGIQVPTGPGWGFEISSKGRALTSCPSRGIGLAVSPEGKRHIYVQLQMRPGERIYGMGERFGAFVKNGQSVDIWNEDGGTSSEQAYKNIPFYMSTAGYGLLVLDHGDVSFEVGSEAVSRIQFSVSGDRLEYLIFDGPTPKDVLRRYTGLTGRPPKVPAWSYGTWLTTSFTTSYDENTVMSFIDGMAERGLPLSCFHFDTFWMREFHWCDFVWDPIAFPDPAGFLARLKERGLRVCVWLNPYIAQKSRLWDEGAEKGYLLRTSDGGIWQTDLWQAGMSLVDFTNPEAVEWFKDQLRALVAIGVDAFKTDFGERIPVSGVEWFDGSDPVRMHNAYTGLYNRAAFEVLEEAHGQGEAVLFARSATIGGQTMPVHWGGDCESTFPSMGETLRGGLSLAMSGFGYWSHDIGGFEGTPDPAVFKRWIAFGFLGSHSRFHGSNSVRVPWAFDEEAVEITREFAHLKNRLLPYLGAAAREAVESGIPMMRPMVLEFPEDRAVYDIDTQYMLGPSLLVAPVFSTTGEVEVYLPAGRWTSLLSGEVVEGGRWIREVHDFRSLPLYLREDSALVWGAVEDRPEYDWAEGATVRLVAIRDGHDSTLLVPASDAGAGAEDASFRIVREGSRITVTSDSTRPWAVEADGRRIAAEAGTRRLEVALEGNDAE